MTGDPCMHGQFGEVVLWCGAAGGGGVANIGRKNRAGWMEVLIRLTSETFGWGQQKLKKKHPTNSVLSVFFLSLWKLSLLLLTPVNLQVQISVGIALQ